MEQSVNNVLMLKSFVDSISPIWQSLVGATSAGLQKIRDLCAPENYAEIEELIRHALNEDVTYTHQPTELRTQRVYAIRVGVNGFLDVARKTFQEINQDVTDMTVQLNEEHDLNLEVKFDPSRQFYFRAPASDFVDKPMPDILINDVRKKQHIECQTLDLMKMNHKIKDAHNEVVSMSDKSIQELIDKVRTRIHPLFKISEAMALLDMLATFAHVATVHDYVRPEITEALAIKAGRHPIRENIQSATNKFIPNDVYATQQNRFQIITGCNMSGKSTYIRFIALMAVMSQTGCFAPASYASFPIFHQLFARVSTDSAVESNVSTFAAEMRDIAHILRNIEPRSLIIIDELGRGTSTTDGLAIAIAIAEALIESKAFVWFVTHFRDLPRILAERAGVVNLHMSVNFSADETDPRTTKMKMTYKVSDGPIPVENQFYGLALARAIHLPERIVDVATQVSEALNERNEQRKNSSKALAVARKRRLVLCLREQLMQARDGTMEGRALKSWLKDLQTEFLVRMEAIDREAEGEAQLSAPSRDVSEAPTPTQRRRERSRALTADADRAMVDEIKPEGADDEESDTAQRAERQASLGDIVRVKQEKAEEVELQKMADQVLRRDSRMWAVSGDTRSEAIVIDSDDGEAV